MAGTLQAQKSLREAGLLCDPHDSTSSKPTKPTKTSTSTSNNSFTIASPKKSPNAILRLLSARRAPSVPRTAYEGLQAPKGVDDLRRWFLMNIGSAPGMNELLFVHVTKNMISLPEHKLLDVFDLLADGSEGTPGYLGFPEFHIFISFLCSIESAQLTHFVFLHSLRLFKLLSHVRDTFTMISEPAPPSHRNYVSGANGHTLKKLRSSYLAVGVGALWRFLTPLSLTEPQFAEIVRDALAVNKCPTTMGTAWSEAALEWEAFELLLACIGDDWDTQQGSKHKSQLRKRGDSVASSSLSLSLAANVSNNMSSSTLGSGTGLKGSARKLSARKGTNPLASPHPHSLLVAFDDRDTDDVDVLESNDFFPGTMAGRISMPSVTQATPLTQPGSTFDDEMDLLKQNTPKPFTLLPIHTLASSSPSLSPSSPSSPHMSSRSRANSGGKSAVSRSRSQSPGPSPNKAVISNNQGGGNASRMSNTSVNSDSGSLIAGDVLDRMDRKSTNSNSTNFTSNSNSTNLTTSNHRTTEGSSTLNDDNNNSSNHTMLNNHSTSETSLHSRGQEGSAMCVVQ